MGDPNEAFINGVCTDLRLKTIDKNKLVRMAMIHIYVCVLDSPTKRDEEGNNQWNGPNDAIAQIRLAMPGWQAEEDQILLKATVEGRNDKEVNEVRRKHSDKKHKSIKKVLQCYNNCLKLGIDFDGEWKYFNGRGRDYKISTDSKEAAIIADALEAGNSIEMTVALLNDYRAEHHLELLGYSAVYSCYKRMKPKVVTFKKRQQGSSDPTSGWAIARRMIFSQVLLRQGEIKEDDHLLDQYRDAITGELPPYFQMKNLTPIDRNRLGYWDEAHRKCRVGASGSRDNRNEYIIFTRTETNKFSMQGSFNDSKDKRKFF